MSASHNTYTALVADTPGTIPTFQQLPVVASLPAGHLRVRVAYASQNGMDGKMARYGNFLNCSEPLVLGFDFSGIVTESNDAAYQVGDKVFGVSTNGGCYATELVVPSRECCHLKHAALEQACTFGIAYSTAIESLEFVANVSQRAGQTIFIAGATGGVGYFSVQIALYYGLNVIASGGKPEALAKLDELHSTCKPNQLHIINYRTTDVVGTVMQLTDHRGADIVYDPTYVDASMTQSAALVAKGGIWMRLGPWGQSGTKDEDAHRVAVERGATATYGDFGRYWRAPEYQARWSQLWSLIGDADELVGEGKLRVMITQTVMFEDGVLQPAMYDNTDGKQMFKVIVKIAV